MGILSYIPFLGSKPAAPEPIQLPAYYYVVAAVATFYLYHTSFTAFTKIDLFSPRMKQTDASKGRLWSYLCGMLILVAASAWPIIKVAGIVTRGESAEYTDFVVSILGAGKSLGGRIGNSVAFIYGLYLLAYPFSLEDTMAKQRVTAKTAAFVYYLLPLSIGWLLVHQLAMYALNGGSDWNGFWKEWGYLNGVTAGTEFDVSYWCAQMFFMGVATYASIIGMLGRSGYESWFKSLAQYGTKAEKAAYKDMCKRTIFWHLNAATIAHGFATLAANCGIPNPLQPGEYLLKPSVGGSPSVHGKNHAQLMLVYAYAAFGAQLVPMLEDNGLWICKILSIQLPLTVYNFFGVIYVIVALGGGTPFHPSWSALGLAPVWAHHYILDIIFFFGTAMLTLPIGVPLIVYSYSSFLPAIGFKPFATAAPNIRTRTAKAGYSLCLATGVWMVFVSSGVHGPMKELEFIFQIPTIHQLDVRTCILLHLADLLHGVLTVGMGVVILDLEDYLEKNFSVGLNLKPFIELWIQLSWAFYFVAKIGMHMNEFTYFHQPLFEDGTVSAFMAFDNASFIIWVILRTVMIAYFARYVYNACKSCVTHTKSN